MSLRTLLAKLGASTLVMASAAAFLLFFGPRAREARADIYARIVSAGGFQVPPEADARLSRPRPVRLNGQGFHYVVGRSPERVDDVLEQYERRFDAAGAARAKGAGSSRLSGPGMGILTAFTPEGTTTPDPRERLLAFARSRRLADLGQLHAIVAYAGDGTTFLHFTADRDARLDGLIPNGSADAAGRDIGEVGRPPASTRVLSVEHGDGGSQGRINVYRVGTSDAEALGHFAATLPGRGWRSESGRLGARASLYVREGGQCIVSAMPVEQGTLVAVVYRGESEPQ